MALKTLTAVTNINNLSDARYCAGMGVEILSFNLTPGQEASITPEAIQEITSWLAGVQIAGEFTDLPVEQINEFIQTCSLNLVQLNSEYLLDDLAALNAPVIQQIVINKDTVESELVDLLKLYQPHVQYFLIASDDFNSIDETNAQLLIDLAAQFPILIGFGLNQQNVQQILKQIKPSGIALKGGQEIKPGLKSFDELANILEVLEED
jgi:phosphoribosylanthranilate isomerase